MSKNVLDFLGCTMKPVMPDNTGKDRPIHFFHWKDSLFSWKNCVFNNLLGFTEMNLYFPQYQSNHLMEPRKLFLEFCHSRFYQGK